jgi:prepilin-type N-terminal cleavage/methylation domain-containing protein/prepilin-type processing-associated H-X9-DG protein
MRRAFTLIEILVVIGILALLAAFLFPAFSLVRARGRQTACASNLAQIGHAVALYTSDWERFPRGLDPADKFTPQIWDGFPNGPQIMAETPLLTEVMQPYVKDPRIWQCAADTGFDICDTTNLPLDARPTCYVKFGMSYFYRTELMLRERAVEDLQKASQTHVMADAAGAWHGANITNFNRGRRYNVLFADSHVKNLTEEQYNDVWGVSVE